MLFDEETIEELSKEFGDEITAEEFLNTLDETDKKIVDMLVKKFTQAEIADEVGLSQSAVSRRLKKISALGKEFEKNISNNA